MKSTSFCALTAGLLSACGAYAQTTVSYTDTPADVAVPGNPYPHLDITSVDTTVSADGATLSFKIHLSGNPQIVNWGKYCIGLRTNPAGGDPFGNGWSRPISQPLGMTHWISSWVDNGSPPASGQIWSYSGNWSITSTPTVTVDSTSVTISMPLSAVGLEAGKTFTFDVYTTSGTNGDGAVDALSKSTATINTWQASFETTAPKSFTVPGTLTISSAWRSQHFTPTEIAALPGGAAADGADPDSDGLTNLQEYAAGTLPKTADSDGDTYSDGGEVSGSSLGYPSNPLVYNYTQGLAVAGNFTSPTWDPTGLLPNPDATLIQTGDVSAVGQFQNQLDFNFRARGTIAYKFTNAKDWAANGHINWGASPTAGVAAPFGTDLTSTIVTTGFHRFFFDTRTGRYSLTRTAFASQAAFLNAYGNLSAGGDADGDGITNGNEYINHTDPTAADTDGDGANDQVDALPLTPSYRDVVFRVDMNVAIAMGIFFTDTNTVRVVGEFDGPWNTNGGLVLSDPDFDGVYTGTYSAPGLPGQNFSEYKFYISGTPETGWENQISNRTFVLGAAGVTDTRPIVYFNDNNNQPGTYGAWVSTYNLTGEDANRSADPDGDGFTNVQEFLFGTHPKQGSASLTQCQVSGTDLVISWLELTSGVGTYTLEENPDLESPWVTSPVSSGFSSNQIGVPSGYQRIEAWVPITESRMFFRVLGVE